MVGNHNPGCMKGGSITKTIIESNGLPLFRIDIFGDAIGKQPIGSTTEFYIEDGNLIVVGENAEGFSVIDGILVYSYIGNVDNDPTRIASCCK